MLADPLNEGRPTRQANRSFIEQGKTTLHRSPVPTSRYTRTVTESLSEEIASAVPAFPCGKR
jgi:hypothetical protein